MKTNLKILLVDSSKRFQKAMELFAQSRGLNLCCFCSVKEMGFIGRINDFDIAIIECDEGILSGNEIGDYFLSFKINIPLILISEGQSPQIEDREEWSKSVSGFIHKDKGPEDILNYALNFVR